MADWWDYPDSVTPNHVAIIGGGIAGCSTAYALAKRGVKVTIYEASERLAGGASANQHAITYPFFAKVANNQQQFYHAAYQLMQTWLDALSGMTFTRCGLLHIGKSEEDHLRLKQAVEKLGVHHWLEQTEASEKAHAPLPRGGVWVEDAAMVDMPSLCESMTAHPLIEVKVNHAVENIDDLEADITIIASAESLLEADAESLALKRFAGQISHLAPVEESQNLKIILCSKGYITPVVNGCHAVGASYEHRLSHDEVAVKEAHARNKGHFEVVFGDTKPVHAWRGIRITTPDRLPVIGPIPCWETLNAHKTAITHGPRKPLPSLVKPNIFLTTAHGSRGLLSAPMAGEIIAAHITRGVLPIEAPIRKAVHPLRFAVRALQKRPSTP